MVKIQAAVGRGTIDSPINSPLGQKISLKLKNNHKNSKKAFSVAEAMIALLIGSVALGMAAPMITKHIKTQNMSDTQFRVLTDRIAQLERELDINFENENAQNEDDSVPQGVIAMWSGSIKNIPSGWALCDGKNGTPDLRNRFIVGAGNSYAIGNTGGEKEVVLTIAQMPRHDHGVMEYAGPWKSGVTNLNAHISASTNGWSSSFTSFTGGNTNGETVAHENRPPYYALAYIMKTR